MACDEGPIKGDTCTFNPLLYKDILDRSYKARYNEMEAAVRAMERGNVKSKGGYLGRRELRIDFHCQTCENNELYKAPNNEVVKFDQYSRLTSDDMRCALFQEESKVYSREVLMFLVRNEQNGFKMFLKSLEPKFIQIALNVPPGYIEYIEQQNRTKLAQFQRKVNFKLSTTHYLGVAPSKATPRCVDVWGALFSYGTVERVKLPKAGSKVKSNVHTLTMEAKQCKQTPSDVAAANISLPSDVVKCLTAEVIITPTPTLSTLTGLPTPDTEEVLAIEEDMVIAESELITELIADNTSGQEFETTGVKSPVRDEIAGSIGEDNLSIEEDINVIANPKEVSPTLNYETASETSDKTPTEPEENEPISLPTPAPSPLVETKPKETVYKHIKLAVTQDQDIFITNVPVNSLGLHLEQMHQTDIQDYLKQLKIANIIAHKEALCLVFSSSPPHYETSFTFKISVTLREDGSKHTSVSDVLPSATMTSETVKQSVFTQSLLSSSSRRFERVEDDANIQFMEYFQSACAQFIHSDGPSVSCDLSKEIEIIKQTSFIPWRNINSSNISDAQYSVFSLGSTNFISHGEHPTCLKLHGVPVDCIVFVKLQHFVQYGLQKLSNSELAYLYLKVTLSGCEGAVIVHIDPNTATIVNIEERSLSSLETFSYSESMERLSSFFAQLDGLEEGEYVYDHVMQQPHSVIYQQFDNVNIHPDYSLSSHYKAEISKFVLQFEFDHSTLTLWQRHNIRLPLCFMPRKAGTYLCHEFLSTSNCANAALCAFAHLTQPQLLAELGEVEYNLFMTKFAAPKKDKEGGKGKGRKGNKNFGKVKNKLNKRKRNQPGGNNQGNNRNNQGNSNNNQGKTNQTNQSRGGAYSQGKASLDQTNNKSNEGQGASKAKGPVSLALSRIY